MASLARVIAHVQSARIGRRLLRRLAVLKLWQVRDPFDPDAFFAKLRTGVYDWDDIRR